MQFFSQIILISAASLSLGSLLSQIGCSRAQDADFETLDAAGESFRAQIQCDGGKNYEVALNGSTLPQKVATPSFSRDAKQQMQNCQIFIVLAQTPQPTQYRWLSKSGRQNVLYQSVEKSVNISESGDILNINARYYKTHAITNQAEYPTCQSPTPDQIKSGWGWENGKTCKVTSSQAAQGTAPQVVQQQQNNGSTQSVSGASSPSGGSGFPLCGSIYYGSEFPCNGHRCAKSDASFVNQCEITTSSRPAGSASPNPSPIFQNPPQQPSPAPSSLPPPTPSSQVISGYPPCPSPYHGSVFPCNGRNCAKSDPEFKNICEIR